MLRITFLERRLPLKISSSWHYIAGLLGADDRMSVGRCFQTLSIMFGAETSNPATHAAAVPARLPEPRRADHRWRHQHGEPGRVGEARDDGAGGRRQSCVAVVGSSRPTTDHRSTAGRRGQLQGCRRQCVGSTGDDVSDEFTATSTNWYIH